MNPPPASHLQSRGTWGNHRWIIFVAVVLLWGFCTPLATFGIVMLWDGLQGGTAKFDGAYYIIIGLGSLGISLILPGCATRVYARGPAKKARKNRTADEHPGTPNPPLGPA